MIYSSNIKKTSISFNELLLSAQKLKLIFNKNTQNDIDVAFNTNNNKELFINNGFKRLAFLLKEINQDALRLKENAIKNYQDILLQRLTNNSVRFIEVKDLSAKKVVDIQRLKLIEKITFIKIKSIENAVKKIEIKKEVLNDFQPINLSISIENFKEKSNNEPLINFNPISIDDVTQNTSSIKQKHEISFHQDNFNEINDIISDVQDAYVQDINLIQIVNEEISELTPEITKLLNNLSAAEKEDISKLHRLVHTLKGTVGQAGALKSRAVIHEMEAVMEKLDDGDVLTHEIIKDLLQLYELALSLMEPLFNGNWEIKKEVGENSTSSNETHKKLKQFVKVDSSQLDRMILDVDQTRLTNIAQEEVSTGIRQRLRELEDVAQRASLLLRELEIQSEIQIQSKQLSSLDTAGFDPLEFDRFTRLQELSKLTNEAVADVLEVRRDLLKLISKQDNARSKTERYIHGLANSLHKARLTAADDINDRMHHVVLTTAKELKKEVNFEFIGGNVELDRVLLEKILGPIDHVLRNSVAHGIETPEERIAKGKDKKGTIQVTVKSLAGRAIIKIKDDGAGINIHKVKQKAIEKDLWPANKEMTEHDAAEIICAPGFSTADKVSQIAGRGVGMDAVRNSVISLGGRFSLESKTNVGLEVTISVPTSISSSPVLLVEDNEEYWALPIDIVEDVLLVKRDLLNNFSNNGVISLADFYGKNFNQQWQNVEFKRLSDLTGKTSNNLAQEQSPVLLLKDQGKQLALEVDKLIQVFEANLQSPTEIMTQIKGLAGGLILPNGEAALLLDPFRMPTLNKNNTPTSNISVSLNHNVKPLVMIVDDSLTVRKVTSRFLTKNDYDSISARDGQEALELLEKVRPIAILLDVEMPKLDGFATAKAIRDNEKIKDIPIIMITSRIAEKHQKRAFDIGVNYYMGKPFKEAELEKILEEFKQVVVEKNKK